MNQKRGFTLLELLVVIAIMGVLMGLLMPAIIKVKKRGKGQLADVQQRAIVSAISAYRLRYHKWPAPIADLRDGVDMTYGEGASGNNVVFKRLELPPDGSAGSDNAVIDMNDFGRRDENNNVLNPYGDAFEITLDLDENHSPSGGVAVE